MSNLKGQCKSFLRKKEKNGNTHLSEVRLNLPHLSEVRLNVPNLREMRMNLPNKREKCD